MAEKRVLPKQFNGVDWDLLYFCTLAQLVKTNDGTTVQDKIDSYDTHLADEIRHITATERSTWNLAKTTIDTHNADNDRHVTVANKNYWNAKEDAANKGIANGYAPLDAQGKLPLSHLADVILGQLLFAGVVNQAGLATLSDLFKDRYGITNATIQLTAASAATYVGAYFIAEDTTVFTNQNILGVANVSTGDWVLSLGSGGWSKIDNSDAVTSVAGRSGAVVLNKNDVGLPNVPNVDATNMANAASGTLTVARGGTGAGTFTAGYVLLGNGTSAFQTRQIVTAIANSTALPTSGAVYNLGLTKQNKIYVQAATPTASAQDIWFQEV